MVVRQRVANRTGKANRLAVYRDVQGLGNRFGGASRQCDNVTRLRNRRSQRIVGTKQNVRETEGRIDYVIQLRRRDGAVNRIASTVGNQRKCRQGKTNARRRNRNQIRTRERDKVGRRNRRTRLGRNLNVGRTQRNRRVNHEVGRINHRHRLVELNAPSQVVGRRLLGQRRMTSPRSNPRTRVVKLIKILVRSGNRVVVVYVASVITESQIRTGQPQNAIQVANRIRRHRINKNMLVGSLQK